MAKKARRKKRAEAGFVVNDFGFMLT